MQKPFVVIMVGLPGSGKSTYVNDYIKTDPTVKVVSTDNIVEGYAAELGKTYDEVWASTVAQAEKEFFRLIGMYIADNKSFIVDRTNLSVKARARILALVPSHYTKIAHMVEVDEHERQQRLKMRPGKTIPINVDTSMVRSYTQATLKEGFDIVQASNTTNMEK